MQTKDESLRSQYNAKRLSIPLQETVLMLECLARRCEEMPNGITITSIYRPADSKSYHSRWRAIDIRNRDWPPKFHAAVYALLVAIHELSPEIQWEFEPSQRHPNSAPHLHLEQSDGSLEKEKKEST